MTIIRRLARPLLAAPMIQNGIDAARHPVPRLENAGPLLEKVSGPLRLPNDKVQVIRAAGGVTAGAGVLLALGKLPRLSALAILVTSPVVSASAPFWTEKDAELRRAKRTLFLKDLGLLGGAMLASVDTAGSPDLAWRSRRAARQAKRAAASATAAASDVASRTGDSVQDSVSSARGSVRAQVKAAKKSAKKSTRSAQRSARKQARRATAKISA